MKSYSAEDIWNCVETGLYFKGLPDRGHCIKGEEMAGGKKAKERITALLCANMTGSERKKLLIVGRSKTPRTFPRDQSKLPVDYSFSPNAWMTTEMFTKWLQGWDRELRLRGKKIALLLDNCSSHPKDLKLDNIKLFFLPPNTTSIMQPLDQGIIKVWKGFYRKRLNARVIGVLDADPAKKAQEVLKSVTLHDVVEYAAYAWRDVKASTIQNCFKKGGFPQSAPEVAIDQDQSQEEEDTDTEFEDLFQAEQGLPTSGELSNHELLAAAGGQTVAAEEEEDLPEEIEPNSLTIKEKMQMIDLLRQFVREQPEMRESGFDALERKVFQQATDAKKQRKIDTFFPVV